MDLNCGVGKLGAQVVSCTTAVEKWDHDCDRDDAQI